MSMESKLSTMHGNTQVFMDRITLNVLLALLERDDSRLDAVDKVIQRVIKYEIKTNTVCMDVPVRVSEVKRIYPNYLEEEPCWYKKT